MLPMDGHSADLIRKAIARFGCNAEHHLDHFQKCQEEGTENYCFSFGDGLVLLANFCLKERSWSLFASGILAPKEEKAEMFLEFSAYCLNVMKASTLSAELERELYDQVVKREAHLSILAIEDVYNWPIVDLKGFNGELLGNDYYELRKVRRKFMRENSFVIVHPRSVGIEALRGILESWMGKRKGADETNSAEYEAWVRDGFEGIDFAACWIVNNTPSAIVAGWQIPNSGGFYLSIVLHNYSVAGLGEMIYLESLLELKRRGYSFCDLGGSDQLLFRFKKKFLPSESYETVLFSVGKKEA